MEDHTLIAVSEEKNFMTYYFGGGWSQWQYPEDGDWFSAVAAHSAMMREPSTWTIE
jgi:hypothetical protein